MGIQEIALQLTLELRIKISYENRGHYWKLLEWSDHVN